MEKERFFGMTEGNTKVTTTTIRSMALESSNGLTVENTLGTGRMANSMAAVSTSQRRVNARLESG